MLERVLALLREHDRFLITTHIRPDGDALGSQLALGWFLRKLGKKVAMINSDPAPENLGWMAGVDDAEVYDGAIDQRERIAQADVILVLDTNALERLGKLAGAVQDSKAVKVLIDHHTDPEGWFDAAYAPDTASSTGELVYELIAAYDPALIDTEIATALYVAIMTDTGSFRYSSVTPAVHRIVADLLERGDLRPAPIHTALFDTRSLAGLRLLGLALETIRLHYDGQIGSMRVSQRAVRAAAAGLHETEGFVNYVLSVASVRAAVIFIEIDAGIKMSFRSQGDAYVNEWAQAFGGGGHRNASGAFVHGGDLDEVFRDVIDAAPRHVKLAPPEASDTLSADDLSYLIALKEKMEG